jgi:hypothetical protein
MRTARIAVSVASIVLFGPSLAVAQQPATDKEVARDLAERGFELLEQGEAEKAIVSFRMAERRVHSPVHQLFIARAEVRLGRLVEALQTYEGIAVEKIPANAPKPFHDAQEDARKELEALKDRTPSVKIVLAGPAAAQARVTLDGAELKPSEVGVARRVNPGKHTIIVNAPDTAEIEKTLTLAEGAYVQTVELTLEPTGVSIPAVVAFSLGGVGLVVGTATGVAYLGQKTSSPALGAISLAGFITGGVGIVTGTLVVALSSSGSSASPAPGAQAKGGPSLYAGVGPSSVFLSGAF